MSEAVATDWDEFARALARCLADLPSRATLVIAAPGNRYVQFLQYDIRLTVELTGNHYLAEPIPATAERRLRELGWSAPVPAHEIENWHRTLFWPISRKGLLQLAGAVAYGLHDALGVEAPADLRAMGWTEVSGELDLTALGPMARRRVF
ncbi:TY-Chap domain-containing protein [Nocardia sp. NPDC003482]|uniref:TY-Chap domain-containing protein n=1 Tax=Nocardia sp. NPDC004068 TaxID=3364303 RepID=UPI00368A10F0